MGALRTTVRVWILGASAIALAGCSEPDADGGADGASEQGDESFVVEEIRWEAGHDGDVERTATTAVYYDPEPLTHAKAEPPPGLEDTSQIAEEFEDELAAMQPDDRVEVTISMLEQVDWPEVPPLLPEPRETPANQQRQAERLKLIDQVQQEIEAIQQPIVNQVLAGGGEILGQFALCNCFAARLPQRTVFQILGDRRVRRIDGSPHISAEQDANLLNDEQRARALMNTDLYFNAGYVGNTYLGVIDSGVNATHWMIGPNSGAYYRDCVTSTDVDCLNNPQNQNYSTVDACVGGNFSNVGHGTQVANIIRGNNTFVGLHGVSGIVTDSWRVLTAPDGQGRCNAPTGSIERALNAAYRAGDQIVNMSISCDLTVNPNTCSPTSSIAAAADQANDRGISVIAAVGNFGPAANSAGHPGNAHKVIAVGAYDTQTGNQYNNQSRGPVPPDNRIKPDVQAPFQVETGAARCNNCQQGPFMVSCVQCGTCDQCLQATFGGTSSASPQIAGAVADLKHFFENNSITYGAGRMYAALFAFGDRGSANYDNIQGSGHMAVGRNNAQIGCGHILQGYVDQWFTGQVNEIGFSSLANEMDIQFAIWWPEATNIHNDIDIQIYDPNNTLRASGATAASVWEMARVPGTMSPQGLWRFRIYAYSITAPTQRVHYFIFSRTC